MEKADAKPKVVALVVTTGTGTSVVDITEGMIEAGADDLVDWTGHYVSPTAVPALLSAMAQEAFRPR